jgi:transposase, IS30 family
MSHLTYEKRQRIQSLLYDCPVKLFQSNIAIILEVSEWTISNELARFKKQHILYDAKVAHERAKKKRKQANQTIHWRIILWSDLEIYIWTCIVKFRSPEQIAWTWSQLHPEDKCSANTLYEYIYKYHPEWKKLYLRRKWKKYRHSNGIKTKIKDRIWIDQRPKEVDEKVEPWHLEWDTVVWENKSDCVVTIVERKLNLFLSKVVHLKPWEKLSVVVSHHISELLLTLPPTLRKTLTLDNWTEFADHKYITETCWTNVYFANPYHSRERWANENMNGLLRQFLPKWSSFKNITQEMLDIYVTLINNRPRKKLNWKSPADVFSLLTVI